MPAVARKVSPDSHQTLRSASVQRGARAGTVSKAVPLRRWHESSPDGSTSTQQETRVTREKIKVAREQVRREAVARATDSRAVAARRKIEEVQPDEESIQESDPALLQGLLDHFGGEAALRAQNRQKEVEARRLARRRARLRHRPFRMTLLASTLAVPPFVLLAGLLWMRSSALELSRQDAALQNKIEATRFELENTRKEIAAVNASPQIEQWATERGWQLAPMEAFDDVSKTVPANSVPANSVTANNVTAAREAEGSETP